MARKPMIPPVLVTTGTDTPFDEEHMDEMATAARALALPFVERKQLMWLVWDLLKYNAQMLAVFAVLDLLFGFNPNNWIDIAKYALWPAMTLLWFPYLYFTVLQRVEAAHSAGIGYQACINLAVMNARLRHQPEPKFTSEQEMAMKVELARFIASTLIEFDLDEVKEAIAKARANMDSSSDPRCKCGQRLGDITKPCPVCKEPPNAERNVSDAAGSGPTSEGCGESAVGGNAVTTANTQTP